MERISKEGVYENKNRNVGKDIKVTSASRRSRKFALYVFLRGNINRKGGESTVWLLL